MFDAKFVCECHEAYRSACEGLEFYQEVEAKKYCVLHCPTQNKGRDFNIALKRKLNAFDFDFKGIYFPHDMSFNSWNFVLAVDFRNAIFNGSADFSNVTFSQNAHFSGVRFSGTTNFNAVTFCGNATFFRTRFKNNTSFRSAKFSIDANFNSAIFIGNVDFFEMSSCTSSFQGTKFRGEASFSSATFSGATYFSNASFKSVSFIFAKFCGDATFGTARFKRAANFGSATFSGKADFIFAKFKKSDFGDAKFSSNADFQHARFCGDASFIGAIFCNDANFTSAIFISKVDFAFAKIESYLRFESTNENPVFTDASLFSLHYAQITKPEQIIFHSVRLQPHCFVNVDSRNFEFTSIDWGKTTIRDELQSLEKMENRHHLLSIAYRRLATNAEDNNRYEEAARFRYASMDARRLERWHGWDIFKLDWLYWLVSGYGERIPRAFICLLVLLLGFSFLYTQVGFETKIASEVAPIVQEMMQTPAPRKDLPLPSFLDGLTYAMSAALLQRPEPKAYTICAKLCVGFEMILVPLQAALLALAIRRRFMR